MFGKQITRFVHTSQRSCCKYKSEILAANTRDAELEINFSRAKVGNFVQSEPQHENPFTSDSFLQSYLSRLLPQEIQTVIRPDLEMFGEKCATNIQVLGRECEASPPYLVQSSAWGRRVDQLVTCQAWKQMKSVSAEEGLISIAYENEFDAYSRVYQMVKLNMFSSVSGLYSCPLAMTDGAAKTIKSLKLPLSDAFSHLTSRDPDKFWTSGQWMTEKRGGSDVGQSTETLALHQQDDKYRLYGYKWFSSATDSDISFTLAKTENNPKLSMFYLKTRDQEGQLNNIQVMKMKNKLGTRQLPTAELLLDGCEAQLIGVEGRGIACISNMLTVTRIHNSNSAVSAMRKILSLSRDYARRRSAFGNPIYKHPLHIKTLASMEIETRGCTALVLDLALKLGHDDRGNISDKDLLLLRLLTPVAKMYTAKMCMSVVSEGLECFGGQGYIEDTGLPTLLRDSQVLPIWEGTSSVMSLDVVRAIHKTRGEALMVFKSHVDQVSREAEKMQGLESAALKVLQASRDIIKAVQQNQENIETLARDLCVSLAQTYIGSLLLEHAVFTKSESDVMTAQKWCNRNLSVLSMDKKYYQTPETLQEESLVFENYDENKTFKSKFVR